MTSLLSIFIRYKKYILPGFVALFLSACGTSLTFRAATLGVSAARYGVFSRVDVNLKEKNYAAADFLAVKVKDIIDFKDPILALPLVEADNIAISSPLGANISQGVGSRLADLGYNVNLNKTVIADENKSLYLKFKDNKDYDFVLKGSYRYNNYKNNIDVFLIITDAKSSKIIASFNYSMPLSKEVKDLSKTQVKIFRISK